MLLNWQLHDGDGPHLLMVHGFLSSAAQWRLNLADLAADFRCITVELLGHGRSAAPQEDAPYLPQAYVAAFEDLRRTLGIEQWLTLGYSMGAGLTLKHALAHPERVLGTAFSNSTSAFADDAALARQRPGSARAAARLRSDGSAALERLAVHPSRATTLPQPIKEALLADAQRLDPQAIAKTLEITLPALSVRDCFSRLEPPALLLHGIKERRFRPLAAYAQTSLPTLNTVELDSGHGVNMEQPDAFNQALRRFKQRCLP